MAQTMSMGQAVGTAAALCVESKRTPKEVSLPVLQDRLREQGAILDMQDVNETDSITR